MDKKNLMLSSTYGIGGIGKKNTNLVIEENNFTIYDMKSNVKNLVKYENVNDVQITRHFSGIFGGIGIGIAVLMCILIYFFGPIWIPIVGMILFIVLIISGHGYAISFNMKNGSKQIIYLASLNPIMKFLNELVSKNIDVIKKKENTNGFLTVIGVVFCLCSIGFFILFSNDSWYVAKNKSNDMISAGTIKTVVETAIANESVYEILISEYTYKTIIFDQQHINELPYEVAKELNSLLSEIPTISYKLKGASCYSVVIGEKGVVNVFIGTKKDPLKWMIYPAHSIEYGGTYTEKDRLSFLEEMNNYDHSKTEESSTENITESMLQNTTENITESMIENTTENIIENTTESFADETYAMEEDDDYILPYSDSDYVTYSDLDRLSKDGVMLARNELYARHGYIFSNTDIYNYFASTSWYFPSVSKDEWTDAYFNEYEKANLEFISNYEVTMGYK